MHWRQTLAPLNVVHSAMDRASPNLMRLTACVLRSPAGPFAVLELACAWKADREISNGAHIGSIKLSMIWSFFSTAKACLQVSGTGGTCPECIAIGPCAKSSKASSLCDSREAVFEISRCLLSA